MNSISLVHMVVQQTWQVALLAGLVWFITRTVGRERPHLSHMLWALVLVKCVTPPIWSSPVGLFSQMSNHIGIVENGEPNANALSDVLAHASGYQTGWRRNSLEQATGIERKCTAMDGSADAKTANAIPSNYWNNTVFALAIAWISGASLVGLFSIVRFTVFVRLICLSRCETPLEVSRCVERLHQRLGLQRQVGVRVVDSLIGPAVYGLWKPIILLPQAIIAGRTELQLEPLLAHEMVHVRRGDLWLAMIQSMACTVGWFHPLVWLASRQVTIESERCCDEETIALLRCKPATYARSLLDVLELKHLLRVAPALPGVRPVDITSSRLERIMRLGQGCRSCSPWWIWSIALVSAVAVLPGAEYVTAQSPEPKKMDESTVAPLLPTTIPLGPAYPIESKAKQEDVIQLDIQILEVASWTEEAKKLLAWMTENSEQQQQIQRLPILSQIPYVNKLFKKPRIQFASTDSAVGQTQSPHLLLSEKRTARFTEDFLEPAKPKRFASPSLMSHSGQTASMVCGSFDPQNGEVLINGYSALLAATLIDKDTIGLSFVMEFAKGPNAADEKTLNDQSAKDVSKSIRKSILQTSVQFRLDQTLVIASQQNDVDGPYEVVVVKCSQPYMKQDAVGTIEQPK
jgi:beta-lactamase regulating signal transducer with metallopeptidase domain